MTKLALAPLLLMAACSPPSAASDPADERADRIGEEAMAIANVMDETQLQVVTKRVAALERKIDELESNPQAMELELLQARLQAVEAKVLTARDAGEPIAVTGAAAETVRSQRP